MIPFVNPMMLDGAKKLRPQDVFATSLYAGTGGRQTITNGLDLEGKGGLVWIKNRSVSWAHYLQDTARGLPFRLMTNSTNGDTSHIGDIGSFGSSGFTFRAQAADNGQNQVGQAYVSWSFRRAKKFFDIVTYTGNGQSGRQIPHELGVVPGMIVVKRRDDAGDWVVRTGPPNLYSLALNSTNFNGQNIANGRPSSNSAATFLLSTGSSGVSAVNAIGATYVAYLFAQNPDLIDCGSYVGNGSSNGPAVTCGSGWSPQFVMIKNVNTSANWNILDAQRASFADILYANTGGAEQSGSSSSMVATQTGFKITSPFANFNTSGNTYIYLAIRSPT